LKITELVYVAGRFPGIKLVGDTQKEARKPPTFNRYVDQRPLKLFFCAASLSRHWPSPALVAPAIKAPFRIRMDEFINGTWKPLCQSFGDFVNIYH
jgi:hypothetical protein